jgi:Zn-dependent protease with chaperone function
VYQDTHKLRCSLAAACLVLLAWLCGAVPAARAQSEPAVSEVATAPEVITEYRLPPEKLAKSAALYRTRIAIFIAGTLYGVAVLIAVLELGLAPRFRDLARRLSPRRVVQAFVFAPLLLLSIDLLSLPLGIYSHSLQLDYGLSVQSWGSWLWDRTKSQLIIALIGAFAVWGLYGFLNHSPRRWWFYGWLTAIPFVLVLVFAVPIIFDPLFNEFDSLQAKQPRLVAQLERVTQRGGLSIDRSRMFEMRASDKVTTYNAYVTGIGASKRVVVWDNTARDLSTAETMFVFGHEQGHYVLQHVWMGIGMSLVGLLVALYLAHRLLGGVLARLGTRWGIDGPDDWASLPVLLLLFTVFASLGQPITAALSRYLEHQADVYALEVIHGLTPDSSQAATRAFQKLGEKGLAYPKPHPLYVFWVFGHPPIHERVEFAARYQPWERGESGRYFK